MSHKEIRLYDDSVIKLTVKQGEESERFPVSNISDNGGTLFEGVPGNILNYDNVTSVSGSFASGELAYTRDTNRLFVGNISEKLKGEQQQTLGGTLTGNKYLGYIDSRKNYTESDNGTPLALTGEGGLLLEESAYRSYNFTNIDENGKIKPTEDKKWQRLSFYNEKYDAYDGDIMYDIYRNALILFDHNIKPEDGTTAGTATIGGKRKTPLMARFSDELEDDLSSAQKNVKQHTADMYGDGYVLLYNVIPDGDTLTFAPRSFSEDGVYDNKDEAAANYSQNVIKVNKVPSAAIIDALDTDFFDFVEGTPDAPGKITIKTENLPGPTDINFELDGDKGSFILINEGNTIKQSDKTIEDIANLELAVANLNAGFADIDITNLASTVETNKGEIDDHEDRITDIEQQLSSGDDPANSMTPEYSLYEVLPFSNGKVHIEPNYEEETDLDGNTINVFLGNYYLKISGTGTFTIRETLTVDVDSGEGATGEGEGEKPESKPESLEFGFPDQKITINGIDHYIPVPVEMVIPMNGKATYDIIGSSITVTKIPVV